MGWRLIRCGCWTRFRRSSDGGRLCGRRGCDRCRTGRRGRGARQTLAHCVGSIDGIDFVRAQGPLEQLDFIQFTLEKPRTS